MNPRVALALLIGIAAGLISILPAARELDSRGIDLMFRLRGPRNSPSRVVVVEIDSKTERAWNAVPRAFWGGGLALITNRILASGASKVGIDVEIAVDTDRYLESLGITKFTPNSDFADSVLGSEGKVTLAIRPGSHPLPDILQAANGEIASAGGMASNQDLVRQLPFIDPAVTPALPALAATLAGARKTGSYWINYTGRPAPRISALDLLHGRFEPEAIRGAVVLLGETYDYAEDRHDTPYAPLVPGVEIQAEATRTLLDGRELHVPPGWLFALVSGFAAGVLASGALSWSLSRYTILAVAFAVVWFVVSLESFAHFDWVLPWVFPLASALVIVPALCYPFRFLQEHNERIAVRAKWGRMVPDSFIHVLEQRRATEGGSLRCFNAALLFVDIEDFSLKSNSLAPGELLDRLNQVLRVLINEVEREGGVVVSFAGDGIAALFDETTSDYKNRAVRAAVNSFRTVERISFQSGENPWKIRVGLASGEVSLALVGSDERQTLTVYGPAVNLASRLEGEGKSDKVPFHADAGFAEAVQSCSLSSKEQLITVKGWQEPVRVLQVFLGERGVPFPNPQSEIRHNRATERNG